jgi:cysteine synthase B
MAYKTIQDTIGNTPLVQLVRIPGADAAARNNVILGKLEGNNPAGSVKDRAAMSMLRGAEERGQIKPGDTLIEATSGNTGIALAMAAAIRGYKMLLIMPDNLSIERRQSMAAYGAQIILTPKTGGMEYARDLAESDAEGRQGHHPRPVRQPGQSARPLRDHRSRDLARYRRPRHPLRQRHGHHRHHHGRVALPEGKERGDPHHRRQPEEGSSIPGIRKWPEAYLPKIFDKARVDQVENVTQAAAEQMARRLAAEEGIFCGISAAGACEIALRISQTVENATIVFVVCDRGDRYLSTGVFPA